MTEAKKETRRRVLSPDERFAEILFGLIMVLSFTGSLSVAEAGREDIRVMLIAALGCNFAWGLIDAVLYLMNTLAERGRALLTLRRVRETSSEQEAQELIKEALPSAVASILTTAELESMHKRLVQLPEPPLRTPMMREDLLGAIGVFLLVFISTFPVTLPFIFMQDALLALRISNCIAIALMFVGGYKLANYAGWRPGLTGTFMVVLGASLVGLTIAFGG